MPIAILPDVDEQRCIGCALCVEICTALGPDVLRVKPVEGWKRGKAFVFYPERCISDGACVGVCPTHAIFWMRPMEYTSGQPVPLHKNGVFSKGWEEG
ncbi:MAG: 4Fe-4S binding protein [Nitrososphaeraceae archaeon]|jgi:formate hydrogenlyase subunit 6/NADH:ubiquinone oxidoreductase subunit I|nr:4Fe-4S binding protein [Nitrososphaeraceae archaeon]MDQ3983546.1 4Fe-4S binding protein [Thermoproteota archaeon]MDQ4022315.1 4Fe-4S binding protein [Thermoproteota archaeon]HKG41133.1 4Fe-4S binding protein [Nitrososphaeraceae archaeon]HKG71748.1 4Fe-4S binding protein [Nitrososphaeraceae archaeon]